MASHSRSLSATRQSAPRRAAVCAVLFFAIALQTFAQEPGENARKEPDIERSWLHLLLITQQASVLRQEIQEMQKQPLSESASKKLLDLQNQLDSFDLAFEITATGIQEDDLSAQKQEKTDFVEEVQELSRPLLQALRDLTEKPRKIDQLKKSIELLERKLERNQESTRLLTSLIEESGKKGSQGDPLIIKYVEKLAFLKKKYDPKLVEFKLEETRQELEDELSTKESLVDSAKKRIRDFMQTRGRNLLVTALTFAALWSLLTRLRKWMIGKQSKLNMSAWVHKLLAATYNALVLAICVSASLLCLYLFNDWLLISLILIALFATAWTMRQWIPKFLQEVKLMLNLGTVREGERVVWQNVPWLVKEIGLQTTLVNERLEDGELKLPVSAFVKMFSRPVVENEPWFPTKSGDWVFLADNTYGRVENQTLELVTLRLKGGSTKSYATAEFLNQKPLNISSGFRLEIEFGLDYGIQAKICDDIPKIFETGLRRLLWNRLQGDSPDFRALEVAFDNAGSSSLNLAVVMDVEGRCAGDYHPIRREAQTALVRICNENGLTIPFTQLQLNLPKEIPRAANPGSKPKNDV